MRLISVVLFVLWLLLGWGMHAIHSECCQKGEVTSMTDQSATNSQETALGSKAEESAAPKEATGPILFNYSDAKPELGKSWDSFKSSWLSKMKNDEDKLEISAYYSAEEKAPQGFKNMGEARADAARKAMGLSKEKTILKGILSEENVSKDGKFPGVDFKVLSVKPKSVEETKLNVTYIRFPYNSTNKLSDSAVEKYLDQVAAKVIKSGERIRLTGHTDSDGRDDYNMKLGKQRADIIKRYLVSKGVKSNKIISLSKGETQPIAPNNTAAGKANNRRTDLEIIK